MSFISGLRSSFKLRNETRSPEENSNNLLCPQAVRPAVSETSLNKSFQSSSLFDTLTVNRVVTTIETTEITYLNSNSAVSPTSSSSPSQQSLSKKRSSSIRRLPFATITSNLDVVNLDMSLKFEPTKSNEHLPALAPEFIPKSNEEINKAVVEDSLETKTNINYAKQGFAFVRASKSNSLRLRRSIRKR